MLANAADRVADVEARSAGFRKELGPLTLVLTQIMYVVGSGWVGTAAKLGAVAPVSLIFAGNTRLPMVAGWDGLLPKWFQLHPRFCTPVNSILFVGAIRVCLAVAGQIGVGLQEAFQVLENVAGILYAFTYLALFAIPLFGARRPGVAPPLWLRAAAGSGFVVSLLYSVLSIFPIIDVASWTLFAAKILTVLIGVNAVGVVVYVSCRSHSGAKVVAHGDDRRITNSEIE